MRTAYSAGSSPCNPDIEFKLICHGIFAVQTEKEGIVFISHRIGSVILCT